MSTVMHCWNFTAHWVDSSFQRQSAVLQAQELSERHTGEYIAVKITKMLEEWKITLSLVHVVIRDNGSNMVKAMTEANLPSFGCVAHSLQLVENDGVLSQRAVRFFGNLQIYSTENAETLLFIKGNYAWFGKTSNFDLWCYYVATSDRLLVSALFSSSILVICISANSHIGVTLVCSSIIISLFNSCCVLPSCLLVQQYQDTR